jgi:hypothetical protein
MLGGRVRGDDGLGNPATQRPGSLCIRALVRARGCRRRILRMVSTRPGRLVGMVCADPVPSVQVIDEKVIEHAHRRSGGVALESSKNGWSEWPIDPPCSLPPTRFSTTIPWSWPPGSIRLDCGERHFTRHLMKIDCLLPLLAVDSTGFHGTNSNSR